MALKNFLSKLRFLPEIFLLRVFLLFLRIYHKIILNTYIDVRECTRGAIYLEAFKQFPDKKFYEIEALVNNVFMALLLSNDKELGNEEIHLLNAASDDGLLLRMISDAHHLDAFSVYILIALNSENEDKYRDKLDIALSYDSNSEAVTRAKRQVKAHQKNQIKSEVFNEMPMIKINLAAILSIAALIPILLYVGGYLYSKIYFDILDTDYTHYFGPIDYLATSLKTTTSVLVVIAIGSVCIYFIFYDLKTVKRVEYHYDQITHDKNDIAGEFILEKNVDRSALSHAISNTKSRSEKTIRKWDIYFGFGAVFITAISFYSAYKTGNSYFVAAQLPLMMLIIIGVAWSGVLRVFSHPMFALFVLILTTQFLLSIISHGIKDANSVLAGKCTDSSKLSFKQKRNDSDDICLLRATDSWVIFYDNQSKSTVAYPREEISFID